ncbi:MAG TPA: hypothetical protein VNQ99_17570 [Xanthobacteraceae bacterium]|nr:hypothetical protein [Xanthobacteraceae bacterium]
MGIQVKHLFTSLSADGNWQGAVQPSNWNEAHDVELTGPLALLDQVAPAAGQVPYFNTTSSMGLAALTAVGRGILGAPSHGEVLNQIGGQSLTQKGQAHGYAALDGDARLPMSQVPAVMLAPSSPMRGGYPVTNLRFGAATDVVKGEVQEADGTVSTVIQRVLGTSNMALLSSTAALRGISFYGQSNAMASGENTTLVEPLFPHHVMTFQGARNSSSATMENPATLQDFEPQHDILLQGAWISTLTGFAIEAQNRDAGRASPGYVVKSFAKGGSPLGDFVEGQPVFENLVQNVARAKAVAALYGRDYVHDAVFIVHGPSGPYVMSTYIDLLTSIVAALKSRIVEATGQSDAPHIFIVQENHGDTGTNIQGAMLGQLKVAQTVAGVSLVGPMYDNPFWDTIHQLVKGRMATAELCALAYHTVCTLGQTWTPLWPINYELDGSAAEIEFAVPEGPLEWEYERIRSVPNGGFTMYAADGWSGPTNTTVESAEIKGNKVKLTLSGAPTGTVQFTAYGETQDVVVDGWGSNRGQLMSRGSTKSFFHRLGYDVPETVNHYAVLWRSNI